MAKKKNRWGKALTAGGGPAGVIAGEIIGNALGQVLADGVEFLGKKKGKGKRRWLARADGAEMILKTLRFHGRQDIPDLVRLTGLTLGAVLRALGDAQAFGLVKFSAADSMVDLTDPGTRTAVALESHAQGEEEGKVVES